MTEPKRPRSYKHPILEHIFFKKINSGIVKSGDDIPFTYPDIQEAANELGVQLPASISNFTLDLTRKRRDIAARLPESILKYGYDLIKRTGRVEYSIKNYAGEFKYVGVGNIFEAAWLIWNENPNYEYTLLNRVPELALQFLMKDEGAALSVIDYCDVLSQVINNGDNSIIRVQSPLKWHPNELDGLYVGLDQYGKPVLYPMEIKALSTGDDINLSQVKGGYITARSKFPNVNIVPICIKMIENGLLIAVLQELSSGELALDYDIKVIFDPPIKNWMIRFNVSKRKRRNEI